MTMVRWLKRYLKPLLILSLLVLGLFTGFMLLQKPQTTEQREMPVEYKDYWDWVAFISQQPDEALAAGVDLLFRHPQVSRTYLRLAQLCVEKEEQEVCREALAAIEPPDALTALYRKAALLRIDPTPQGWQQLAEDPSLDPSLARWIVDHAAKEVLEVIEQQWKEKNVTDPSALGVTFGLAVMAIGREKEERAIALLEEVIQKTPEDPRAYWELGDFYRQLNRVEKAIEICEQGVEKAQRAFDLETELKLQGRLGWLYVLDGQISKAESYIQEALKKSQNLSDKQQEAINLLRLGNILHRQYRYTEVIALHDSTYSFLAHHAPAVERSLSILHGVSLVGLYRFSEAEMFYEEELRRVEEEGDIYNEVLILTNLANIRVKMGRTSAGREAFYEAIKLAEQHKMIDVEIYARTMLASFEADRQNFEAAILQLKQAQALAQQVSDQDNIRSILAALGRNYLHLGDTQNGRYHFEALLDILKDKEGAIDKVRAYEGLGRTYMEVNNLDEAFRYFDLALQSLGKSDQTYLQHVIILRKVEVLIRSDAYEEALILLEEILQESDLNRYVVFNAEFFYANILLSKKRYKEALTHILKAEKIQQALTMYRTYWPLAFLKAQVYQHIDKMGDAEGAYEETIAIVETVRENLASAENRSVFVQDKVQVYKQFSAFLEAQGRHEEALHYVERVRSRSLVDQLYTTLKEQKFDSTKSIHRVVELERRVRGLTQELSLQIEDSKEMEEGQARQLRREYRHADSLFRAAERTLQNENAIYSFNPLQPRAIKAVLKQGEAMVVYDLRKAEGESAMTSVAYIVLPDTVLLRKLPVDASSLEEIIYYFREQIGAMNDAPESDWQPASKKLHRLLVEPWLDALPSAVRHLHVVPEGMLNYVPFAALQDANGTFLVERFSLSLVPSASVLRLTRARNSRRRASMLLVGDPDKRLPGSRKEVQDIVALRTASTQKLLLGKEARREAITQVANAYDVIHFATHGKFIAKTPWHSYLDLYEDEVLTVEAISQLKLDANLVTLSACESALSSGVNFSVPAGEEWIGFNQAFLSAGATSVLTGLWPIDDQMTGRFMTLFYEKLATQGKAQALAAAQRHFILNPKTQHPFYWAAFSLYGDSY